MNNVVIEQLIMRNGQETNVVVMLKSKTRDKMLTLMAKKIELKCRRDTVLIKSEERKDKFKKKCIFLKLNFLLIIKYSRKAFKSLLNDTLFGIFVLGSFEMPRNIKL